MSKKTCDAFFCSNKTPKKYRYCYDCAKKKGLVDREDLLGWILLIIIVLSIFG